MTKKIVAPEDIKLPVDQMTPVDSQGRKLLNPDDPDFLGTAPIYLSRTKPVKAVQMFLPPGISKFYVERIDKNHIRFLIRTEEINRLADKIEVMEKGINGGKKND